MGLVSTSEERFEDLSDYPYEPQSVDVGGPEMAYVEEGDGEETFLCLHGEPTWGYLYRKMIPTLTKKGESSYRISSDSVAPISTTTARSTPSRCTMTRSWRSSKRSTSMG